MSLVKKIGLVGMLTVLSGCAGMERFGTKVDMAANRLAQAGTLEYEGELESSHRVGAMVSLQFVSGRFFDVNQAPHGLVRGDIVRIYLTDKGYVASMWKSHESVMKEQAEKSKS
jgi:hypothetical protein